MSANLACPQCRCALQSSGVCPKCSKSFVTANAKPVRRQGTIVKAKPYRAPGTVAVAAPAAAQEPSSSNGVFVAVALAFLLLVLGGGGLFWMTRSPGEKTAHGNDPAPVAIADASKPAGVKPQPNANVTAANSVAKPQVVAPPTSPTKTSEPTKDAAQQPEPDPVTTTVPRAQRPMPKVESVPEQAPVTFAEFKTAPSGKKSLKPFSKHVNQDQVDTAIALGKGYLKANKASWIRNGGHGLGYAALPALALLEVGVPADDSVIQEAADTVRKLAPANMATYEISLAILFLDRLGDPADEALIKTLGLRLIAGQGWQHGWDYRCQPVAPELEQPLFTMLEKLRPQGQWAIPLGREKGKAIIELAVPLNRGPDRIALATPLEAMPVKDPKDDEFMKPSDKVMPFMLGDQGKTADIIKQFPDVLQKLPVAQPFDVVPVPGANPNMPKNPLNNPLMPKNKFVLRPRGGQNGVRDDNSNSQFALLALWVARRHGVPVERSLLLADQRYATSQQTNGDWGYHVNGGGVSPQMTCVGLLGLAMGHGTLLGDAKQPAKAQEGGDPAIKKGLEALGRSIGGPNGAITGSGNPNNLYYLWSLERVGMLYQLETIGGKDWYAWGANHLLKTQAETGQWQLGIYPGSSPPLDTAFALLFLHRSNLVSDLSERLQLHMPIVDDRK